MKRCIRLLLVTVSITVMMIIGAGVVSATEIVDEGTCGEDLTWTLDDEGTLIISGMGDMTSYSSDQQVPWRNERDVIKTIQIEEGVTSIGNLAFCRCVRLSSITIPEGVMSIGDYVLYDCDSMKNIKLPESATEIGRSAFSSCNNLSDITIPDNVSRIGRGAFYSCDNLTSVTLPKRLTSIEDETFYWCTRLTDITIPEGVTNIGKSAFFGCRNLPNVTIPEGVTSIGESAFSSCDGFTDITIPESVTEIGKRAFSSCYNLKKITLPKGLTTIEEETFIDCECLTSVIFPDSLKSIGNNAFERCIRLTSITLPEGLTEIGKFSFYDCRDLHSVIIPKSVTNLADNALTGFWEAELKCEPPRKVTTALTSLLKIKYPCSSGWTENERLLWNKEAVWNPVHTKGEIVDTVQPTCTKEGYSIFVCGKCGEHYNDDIIPATGHSWKHYKLAAGFLKNGTEYDYCTVCNVKKNAKTLAGYATYYVKSLKVAKAKKGFTVKWAKQSAANQKKFNGYQIRYSLKSNMAGAKMVTAAKSSKSKKISKLKAKKTYYVQVRTFTKYGGKSFYSKWSAKKSVKTK